MAAGLTRVRRARRVGGMCYESTAWAIRSSGEGRASLRRDNRATRGRLYPINVGTNVAAVEGPLAQSAYAGPEVPLERANEAHLGHARRAGRLARICRAIAADDDIA